MGQPILYTPELFEYVCSRIENGEALTAICRDEGMPARGTILLWAERDEEHTRRYARARTIGYDAIAEDLRTITRGGFGSSGDVQRDKLIADTDIRLLKCWDPKRYGDKFGVDGAVGVTIKVVSYGTDDPGA